MESEHLDSASYENNGHKQAVVPRWIKVGAIAAATVVAGGLAATWFYRKTLRRLRQAEHGLVDSNFNRETGQTEDESWTI